MAFKFSMTGDEFPSGIANLIEFIIYGDNDPKANLLRSIRVKNRDVALLLALVSGNFAGRELMRRADNLNRSEGYRLSRFDLQNKCHNEVHTHNKSKQVPEVLEFNMRGITYDFETMHISIILEISDVLRYLRIYF